jgi:hypothetical protein
MNQYPTALRPGDTVIHLRYLSMQCSLVTGCITAGILLYRARLSGLQIVTGLAVAALVGIGIGSIFARTFFPVRPGHVFVVRRERSALPLTLRAALIPSLIAAVSAAVTITLLGLSPLGAALLIGAVVATSVGCLFGSGSALVK